MNAGKAVIFRYALSFLAGAIVSAALSFGVPIMVREIVGRNDPVFADKNILRENSLNMDGVLIIDYGDDAVMSCYLPDTYKAVRSRRTYRRGDVVDKTLEQLAGKGISLDACFAMVNATTSEDLERICAELRNAGVRIEDAGLEDDASIERDVVYWPQSDRLVILRPLNRGTNEIGPNSLVNSFRTIYSPDFICDTAVIIDYGNEALFARCRSEADYEAPLAEAPPEEPLTVQDAMRKMTDMLTEAGIAPSDCIAAVYSGSKRGLEAALQELAERSIPVRWTEAEDVLFPPVSIYYDPPKNTLYVNRDAFTAWAVMEQMPELLVHPKEYYIARMKKMEIQRTVRLNSNSAAQSD